MWRWSILFTFSSCSVTEMKKKKNCLVLKLGKCKLLAEALHKTVSQSALENLAESCSNIENGECHVLLSFSRHDCGKVLSCTYEVNESFAVGSIGSAVGCSRAGWQPPSGSTPWWRLALAALSFQLQRRSLLHMGFFITCMESPFTSVRIYALNECRGANRNTKGRWKGRMLLKRCNASFPEVQES